PAAERGRRKEAGHLPAAGTSDGPALSAGASGGACFMTEINVAIAFLAGLASFVSPCCLPLYPSYLSYITGVGVNDLKDMGTRGLRVRTLSHAVAFAAGFSVVFYTLGYGAGAFGDFFKQYQSLISKLSAVLIIAIGLFLIGVFRPAFLMRERRLNLRVKPAGLLGTFAVGIGFAARSEEHTSELQSREN